MSKVAAYLQEHILGEVSIQPALLSAFSYDASVLTIKPEMVVYPRVTNDIRKVARFAWQLAEKGHILPITARGSGTDQTGAAIGRGIILNTTAHMNQLLEFDARQKLVRVQPGLNAKALNDALALQGMAIPVLPRSQAYSTIGGAVANAASGPRSGRHGTMAQWAYQLEVVLANGDILQTSRLTKRDLSKKKGLQTLEGEIYRAIDNLIEDNRELIEDKLASDSIRDNTGYMGICDVKERDGSFDLTPLIIGSQGTLGVVSEMILRTDFIGTKRTALVAAFPTAEAARDAVDALNQTEPTILEYYDGGLFVEAAKQGVAYQTYSVTDHRAALVAVYEDFNDHAVSKRLKKAVKYLEKTDVLLTLSEDVDIDELLVIRDVTAYTLSPQGKGVSAPPFLDGVYVPADRREEFVAAAEDLARKHHVELSLYGDMRDHIWYARPQLQLVKVGDKQKVFKLLEDFTTLVSRMGGCIVAESGEGRLKTHAAYKELDSDVVEFFAAIKAVFDPHGILNPGVKQPNEIRTLASQLRSDYDAVYLAGQSLAN